MGKVNLDNVGRAFAYCVWASNVDDWRHFKSAAGDNPLAVHLARYPGQNSSKLRMTIWRRIPPAVAARDAATLANLIPFIKRQQGPIVPVAKVAACFERAGLESIRPCLTLAEQVVAVRHAPDVATFAASYAGPKGKVEAAAEQFGLSLHEAAECLRPKRPAVQVDDVDASDALRQALEASQRECARLRFENRGLRTLVSQYLPTDDL